jgi:hypothetical protein
MVDLEKVSARSADCISIKICGARHTEKEGAQRFRCAPFTSGSV